MRSKIAQQILDETPNDVKLYAEKYADLVVLISQTLKAKGWTQKTLAEKLDKKPSEISKWLKGDHNFTIKSICKLEAELEETLIYIPKVQTFSTIFSSRKTFTVHRNNVLPTNDIFINIKHKPEIETNYAETA